MKDYGITYSGERPLDVDIKETKVFVAEDITVELVDVSEDGDSETPTQVPQYKFRLLEYTKDEYIALLDESVTNAQLAICELYEEMIV